MILSHPHADHIGGAETLLNTFEVDEVVMCSYVSTSKMFNSLLDTLETKNILTTQAKIGLIYEIDGVKIEVLAVDTLPKDNNNSSIVNTSTYSFTTKPIYIIILSCC
jgi:competence protein ComEC